MTIGRSFLRPRQLPVFNACDTPLEASCATLCWALSFVSLIATGSSLAAESPGAARTNVLFIRCDDLRWDCLSSAGHPHLKTPHAAQLRGELDRLMAEVGITNDKMPLDEGVKQQLPDQKIR